MRYKNFLFLFAVLISVIAVSAAPQNPYVVYGKVTINGEGVSGMTVRLTNLGTLESQEFLSKYDGAFGFYLEQWNNGYAEGNQLKLTYCISDTRCNEKEATGFSVDGSAKLDLGIFNSDTDGSGGSAPYIISGTIKKDGTFITTGSITLMNVNTGEQVSIDLDAEGYQYNLANLDNGYNTGDTIRIIYDSTDYDFVITGDNKVFDIVKTTPSTPGDSGDSGSGDGGTSPGAVNIPAGCSNENKRYWVRGEDCAVTCGDFDDEMMINRGYALASYNCFIKEEKEKDKDFDGDIDDIVDDKPDDIINDEEEEVISMTWLYWLIGIVVVVGAGYYFFFRKKG